MSVIKDIHNASPSGATARAGGAALHILFPTQPSDKPPPSRLNLQPPSQARTQKILVVGASLYYLRLLKIEIFLFWFDT